MNWKEIDLVLSELPLRDSQIQKIVQPDFRNLILTCYSPESTVQLLVCLEPRACRMHRTNWTAKPPRKAQRFAQLLKSRIQGGRIVEVEHVNHDRIVRFTVRRGGETLLLWIRLWGPAANVILCDETGLILDTFFRRPAKAETSGGRYHPAPLHRPVDDSFQVRDLPGERDFNSRLDAFYRELSIRERLQRGREQTRRDICGQLARLTDRRASLEQRILQTDHGNVLQKWGDLIMANLHMIAAGDRWITVEDYAEPGTEVTIELDPALSATENAEQFYRRQKKTRAGRTHIEQELEQTVRRVEELTGTLAAIETITDPAELERDSAEIRSTDERNPPPGLSFRSGSYRILVGRTAKENDELLRRFARGNDIWLHARDYPGGYVFVKQIPGKSVPLDVLLDAANLALVYSKSRGDGDVYYTPVKYLRRAKHGKTGTVIPTQEKNLSVRIDQARLTRLRGAKREEKQ